MVHTEAPPSPPSPWLASTVTFEEVIEPDSPGIAELRRLNSLAEEAEPEDTEVVKRYRRSSYVSN